MPAQLFGAFAHCLALIFHRIYLMNKYSLLKLVYLITLSIFFTVTGPVLADGPKCKAVVSENPFPEPSLSRPDSRSQKMRRLGNQLASLLSATFTDLDTIYDTNKMIKNYSSEAQHLLRKFKKIKNSENLEALEEIIKTLNFEEKLPGEKIWLSEFVRIKEKETNFKYNVIKIPRNEFADFLQDKFPSIYATTVRNILEIYNDNNLALSWMQGLRAEVILTMWNDGISDLQAFREPALREFYLDLVLAQRAKRIGFQVTKESLPFTVTTFNPWTFFRRFLEEGRIFIDWTATTYIHPVIDKDTKEEKLHSARGHILQMVYLGEHIPRFVDFIRNIGQTNDKARAWEILFDNADSTSTPFWSGRWVDLFKNYLNIRN